MSSRPSFNYHYERLNNIEPNSTQINSSSNINLYLDESLTSANGNNNQSDKSESNNNNNHQRHLNFDNLQINSKLHSSSSSGHHSHSSSTSSASDFSNNSSSLVQVSFKYLIQVTVALPLAAFLFNIFYVLNVDFDKATNTICNNKIVKNSLPSFSSVIGQFQVAKSLWNIAIALHASPRLLFVAMIYSYLISIIHSRYHRWVKLACICNLIENIGLIVLSYVPSNVHFPIHMWSFIAFLAGSEIFMLIYCILSSGKKYRNIPIGGSYESKSLRFKWQLFYINFACTMLSTIAYYRHESHCEDGVYTMFAFFEYIVVLTNMAFHMTSYYDFYDKILRI